MDHSMVPIFLLLLSHVSFSYPFYPVSGGVYDLSAIADALKNDVTVPDTVGNYEVILPNGSLFYIDPTDTTENADVVIINVEIRNWKNSVMLDGEKLFLCRPFDATYKSCPLVSSTGIIRQNIDSISQQYTDTRSWTFSLDLTFIRQYVYTNEATRTQQSVKTLIVSGRLNPIYHENLAKDPNLLRRPLPIVPIHIHNKYVMNIHADERNLVACENSPSSYVKMEPDLKICNHQYTTMKNTKTTQGNLFVYTPNEHGIPAIGTTCYILTYSKHEICSGFLRKSEIVTQYKHHTVSDKTCKLWQETRVCTANNMPMERIHPSSSIYRARFLSFEKTHRKFCVNRHHHATYHSNCVMDMNSPLTYRFPFTHIESTIGSIPLFDFFQRNYWISKDLGVTLIWNNTDHQIGKPICPYTLLKSFGVKAIYRDNLQMSHDLHLGIDASVQFTVVFLGESIENSYQVTDKQQIGSENLKKLNMEKCAEVKNICFTYITDDNILLQFCPNSLSRHSYMSATNIHHKSPLPPILSRYGVHPIPKGIDTHRHTLESLVCEGFLNIHTDQLSHRWKCKNGFPTFVGSVHYTSSTNSNIKQEKINNSSSISRKKPELSFAEEQWIVSQLQQLVDKECETRSMLQKIAKQVSLLSPSVVRQFIDAHNPIQVSKSGHHYGIHTCETINWRNVEMMPSLLTNHPSIREFNTEADMGLCYTHPVIKIVSAHQSSPMIAQLMPNNHVSFSLTHVEKCQNDRKKLFTLGDTMYVFSENNNLEDTHPAHHHTVAQQLLSKYNKLNSPNTTPPKLSDIIYTVRPEIASSTKNKVFMPHSGQLWDHSFHRQFRNRPKSKDGEIATSVSRIESTLARVHSLVNPIHIDLSKEQEHILQSNDALNQQKSIRTTRDTLHPHTHGLDPRSWFVKEAELIKAHFDPFVRGFTAFVSFCVVPIIILVVIVNWVELRAFRTGPVNASSGAAIGQIDKISKMSVHDKIHKNKVMFIARGIDNNGFVTDESILPRLPQT